MLRFLNFKCLFAFLAVAVIVVVAAGALYVAAVAGVNIPGIDAALRVDPETPSPEVLARSERVEASIREAIEDNSAFYIELTDQDLTALLVANVDTEGRVHKLAVEIRPDDVKVSGQLAGRIGVGFSGVIGLTVDRGEVAIELKSVNLSGLPTPGFVNDEIQPLIDEVLDINERLRESGATQIQSVELRDGSLIIIGVQAAGATVADSTVAALQDAVSGAGGLTAPATPGADIVPPGRTASEAGSPVYLALGDSLAANVGVDDPLTGYVSRFHRYLEGQRGETLGLINLGISGESSVSIQNGQLQQALDVLRGQQVAVLSIDLGANDLLSHLGAGACRTDPQGAECSRRLEAATGAFEANFEGILSQLKSALPQGAEFYVMTAYNPFDLGLGIPFEEFSSGVISDLNAIIVSAAGGVGATVADPFDDMAGNAGAWTNLLTGSDIHPNSDGYQVLALSLAEARDQ